jgi:pimeloyl-ACP methyl ester carboxylesterase
MPTSVPRAPTRRALPSAVGGTSSSAGRPEQRARGDRGVRSTPMAGTYADLPGVRMWYLDTGGDGVPVVLLHPHTGTSETFADQLEAFSDAGFRAIAPDRRGSGHSVAIEDGSAQPGSLSEDLEALVAHLGLAPFHLVAVAGGAFAALDYAAWKPGRLLSLVAGATMGWIEEDEIRQFFSRIQIEGLRAPSPVSNLELSAGYRGAHPDGTRRWIEIETAARRPGAPTQPLREKNTYEKLRTITTPVLALAGGADLVSPPALMRLWAAQLPDVEFAVLPEAGHAISWEDPDRFNERVLSFIARH